MDNVWLKIKSYLNLWKCGTRRMVIERKCSDWMIKEGKIGVLRKKRHLLRRRWASLTITKEATFDRAHVNISNRKQILEALWLTKRRQ